ncbi:MAG TPA: M20/M25/M40 family metallo-hydrolase [Thermoanaerobaculia bacterium]|jgi:hypothetical protein|nr:M20/M25/M40 family metallo-hydrolase [Thermoanaerobaculia bacterium]
MSIRCIAFTLIFSTSTFIAAQTPSLTTPDVAITDFVAPVSGKPFPAPLASRVADISAAGIGAHINLLASPALEGRGLGTRGLEAATEYAAATLRLAGIPPYGAIDSYYQAVPLRQITGTRGQVEIERRDHDEIATRTFASGVDCLFSAQPAQTLKAPVVFAGFGIRELQLGRDDYAGLDVRGRIVLIVAGVPGGAAWHTPELLARYAASGTRERYAVKLETARALGAAAVFAVEDEGFATGLAENVADEERAFRSYDRDPHEPPMLVRVSRSVAYAIAGEDVFAQPVSNSTHTPQSVATATIRISGEEHLIVSRNVLGILLGSDPKLRDEAVIIGAHIDHLGMADGVIHPGADDNASGVAALLEIAKTFAASPEKPKRTLIFAFWTGEEEGHLGSAFNVNHPRWPLAHIHAYLNLDMIGHPWLTSEIRKLVDDNHLPDAATYLASITAESFVEPGVPRGFPALERAVRDSARGNGLAMHIDWTDGTYGGSDYRDFARAGVPFIRFFGNFFPDYHKPGDTPDRLDIAQVQRIARFAFATAWELANR